MSRGPRSSGSYDGHVPDGSSWTPLPEGPRRGRAAFVVPPFVRLARTHALSTAGDAAVAVALAGSLFFSINPSEARWRVALYLLLTLAPFAVVAPLIGPAIDRARGGSRWVILAMCGGRAMAAVLMVFHLDSLLLFPEAFAMLVLGKGYSVAKSAYLPTTVASNADLVGANSKLAIISPVAGGLIAAPAALLSFVGGSSWAMALAALVFVGATLLALRLPAVPEPEGAATGQGPAPPTPEETAVEGAHAATAPAVGQPAEPRVGPTGAGPTGIGASGVGARGRGRRLRLRSDKPNLPSGVILGASAMGLLRGSVGFLTFLIAFDLRTSGASTAGYGLVLGAVGAGSIGGALLAPQLRRHVREERLMAAALVATTAAALLAALVGGLGGALLVIAAVGVAAAVAKLAFDSVVQRDSGERDKGRAFASFESRFQVLWVLGALVGLSAMPMRVGFLLLAGLAGATAVAFVMGRNIFDVARDFVTVPADLAQGPDDAADGGEARAAHPRGDGTRSDDTRMDDTLVGWAPGTDPADPTDRAESAAPDDPTRPVEPVPEAPTLADVFDVLANHSPSPRREHGRGTAGGPSSEP